MKKRPLTTRPIFFQTLLLLLFLSMISFLYVQNLALQREINSVRGEIKITKDSLSKNLDNVISDTAESKNFFDNRFLSIENFLVNEKNKNDKKFLQNKNEILALNVQSRKLENELDLDGLKTRLIKRYRDILLKVSCDINDKSFYGSAAFLPVNLSNFFTLKSPILLSNRHVFYENGISFSKCELSNDLTFFKTESKSEYMDSKKKDYIIFETNGIHFINDDYRLCSKQRVLGENILVMGYPQIGDTDDITVTEGIISGYEEGYYIVSAKIAKGNSGGVAISIPGQCILGIPTFTKVGKTESLGRVLDIRSILLDF